MTDADDRSREDSLLNEIYSLAPYFSYDQGKSRTDDTGRNGAPVNASPERADGHPGTNWNDRMKAYVLVLTQSLARGK